MSHLVVGLVYRQTVDARSFPTFDLCFRQSVFRCEKHPESCEIG